MQRRERIGRGIGGDGEIRHDLFDGVVVDGVFMRLIRVAHESGRIRMREITTELRYDIGILVFGVEFPGIGEQGITGLQYRDSAAWKCVAARARRIDAGNPANGIDTLQIAQHMIERTVFQHQNDNVLDRVIGDCHGGVLVVPAGSGITSGEKQARNDGDIRLRRKRRNLKTSSGCRLPIKCF